MSEPEPLKVRPEHRAVERAGREHSAGAVAPAQASALLRQSAVEIRAALRSAAPATGHANARAQSRTRRRASNQNRRRVGSSFHVSSAGTSALALPYFLFFGAKL